MSTSLETAAPPTPRLPLREWVVKYSLVPTLLVVVAFFAVYNPEIFATWSNARTIMATSATIALLALAAMLPLAVGQFDISVGFQFGFAQALCAGLVAKQGLPPAAALTAVLLVGCGIGLVNGLLVTVVKLPAFIATLGSGILVLGATQWYSGDLTVAAELPVWFTSLGRGTLAGIPNPFWIVVIAGVLLFVAQELTSWGRHAYATGGNPFAAELAGVPVRRVTLQSFTTTGALCATSGVLSVAILGASSPVVGLGSLLPAFAGAFLGATSIRPGRFNAVGTIIAVYLVAVGITGLRQLGAQNYVEQLFYGAALLVAVFLGRRAAE
jgi:ribose transport system permease protein